MVNERWRVRSEDARKHLRDMLNSVQYNDEHITIMRYDTPAAVLVPVEWHRDALSALEDQRTAKGQEQG